MLYCRYLSKHVQILLQQKLLNFMDRIRCLYWLHTEAREVIVGNYIIQKGICSDDLRDEIYCQLCSQTWLNPNDVLTPPHLTSPHLTSPHLTSPHLTSPHVCACTQVNAERGWLLMAMVLSVLPPSPRLFPYLLCYVTAHGVSHHRPHPSPHAHWCILRIRGVQGHLSAQAPPHVWSPEPSPSSIIARMGGRTQTCCNVLRHPNHGAFYCILQAIKLSRLHPSETCWHELSHIMCRMASVLQ